MTETAYEFLPGPSAPGEARAAVRGWALARGLDGADEPVELLQLVVSELVTNAVRHGAGAIKVRLETDHGRVRIGVHDDGRGTPVRREPSVDVPGGRGLGIVETVDREWEVCFDGAGGKTVWVTLPAPVSVG